MIVENTDFISALTKAQKSNRLPQTVMRNRTGKKESSVQTITSLNVSVIKDFAFNVHCRVHSSELYLIN